MKTDPRLWARAVPLTRGASSPAEAMTGRAAGPRESARRCMTRTRGRRRYPAGNHGRGEQGGIRDLKARAAVRVTRWQRSQR